MSTGPASFAAWGDSFTFGSGTTAASKRYTQQLFALSARYVFNGGVAGETSTQIKTRMVADTAKRQRGTIIWAGYNNLTSPSTVLADVAAMVHALGHDRFLVLSVTNGELGADEWVGGSRYNNIATINAGFAQAYGARYVDVRSHLISLYNPGIPQDVIDVGHDIVPSSLRSDIIHLNDAGYAAVAAKVFERIDFIAPGDFMPSIGTRIGSHLGNSIGTSLGNDAMAGVTKDDTRGVYAPASATEWATTLAAASITSGGPMSAWAVQEPSGTLDDAIGPANLSISGSFLYQQPVTGWDRGAMECGDVNGANSLLSVDASLPDCSAVSALLIGYVAIVANAFAPGDKGVLLVGDVRADVTATIRAKIHNHNGSNTATGSSALGTTVRPWVLRHNVTNSSAALFTDQEKVAMPSFTASGATKRVYFAGSINNAPGMKVLYGALFKGAAAELTDAQVRTLLQTLGWSVAW